MKTPERHLKGSPTAPLNMEWYEQKAKALMEHVDFWMDHHDKGCPLMARIFSIGMNEKDLNFFLLVEKDGLYYASVGHAEAGETPYGKEDETGLRPGMPLDAEKYRENGEKYLALALLLSAKGCFIHLHEDYTQKGKPVQATFKVQAYLTKEQIEKLDAECKKLQISRAAEIRRLVDAL